MEITNNEPIILGTKWTGKFSAQEIMKRYKKYSFIYVQKSASKLKPSNWELAGEIITPPLIFIVVVLWMAIL